MKKGTAILKWVCLVTLMVYVTWATVWAHNEAAHHICRDIAVDVESPAPIDSIIRRGVAMELKDYPGRIVGVPINQVDTRRIEKYLGSLNTFESVNCMVSAGGTLNIRVTPMIPVMRVFLGNKSYYINKDGKHIASNAEFYRDVPVVTGRFTRDFQPVDVLPLVRFVERDKTMHDLTAMIEARDARNLIVVPKITGHVVNFGDTTRLEQKRDALKLFYTKVMPHKGWEQYDTISVKFRNQIVATRRDKTRLNVSEEPVEEIDLEEGTLPGIGETAGGASANAGAPDASEKKVPSQQKVPSQHE